MEGNTPKVTESAHRSMCEHLSFIKCRRKTRERKLCETLPSEEKRKMGKKLKKKKKEARGIHEPEGPEKNMLFLTL